MQIVTRTDAAKAESNGFLAVMPPDAARQQLRVSLAVAAAFAVAAVLALSAGQLKPVYSQQSAVKLTIELPASHFARQADAGTVSRKGI